MNRLPLVLLSLLIAITVIGGAAYYRYTHPLAVTTQPTTLAVVATRPAATTSKPVHVRGPTTQLLDILRANDPQYPTTQRLASAVDLKYAARFILNTPIYLDPLSNLWVTRPDAPETFDFLKAAQSDTATYLVRDQVVFVLWSAGPKNKWSPHLIVRNPAFSGYLLVDERGRRALPDPYGFQWDRALILPAPRGSKDHIVVPTATGACAFAFDDDPQQILQGHHRLGDAPDKNAHDDRATQLVMDVTGVIAYVTNAAGTAGIKTKNAIARFAATPTQGNAPPETSSLTYAWSPLTDWPDHILHLMPLLDGSVLEILSVPGAEKDKVAFSVNSAAPIKIDEKAVQQLIDQLSNDDPAKRELAFKQLTTYGAGITPLLERALDEQSPEAQIRIHQLLKNKVAPSLGSMSLVDSRMRVVNRLPDGGVIFYAENGVSVPRADDSPAYVTPAWLSIRPGRAVELLPPALVADLQPDKQRIIAWGSDNLIVEDPVLGPQWYFGNHLEPLLRKEHRRFSQFVGIDANGRWLFRAPPNAPIMPSLTTQPATTRAATQIAPSLAHERTLVIDPWLPDPTPRLPAWELPMSAGKAGWDKNGWPVIYMEAKPTPVPWALEEGDWHVLDLQKDKVFTDPPPLPQPPPTLPATTTTSPTTATTAPSTAPTSAPSLGNYLLTASDGTRYYGGLTSLTLVHPDGSTIHWPLPQSAVGSHEPTLLQTHEGLLFLFNEPGRITRLRTTDDPAQPLKVEATFTRGIPSDPNPQRIWLDPAGRICITHDQSHLTVLFPLGRIPPAIAAMMPASDENQQE